MEAKLIVAVEAILASSNRTTLQEYEILKGTILLP